jgi:hypothetical protein
MEFLRDTGMKWLFKYFEGWGLHFVEKIMYWGLLWFKNSHATGLPVSIKPKLLHCWESPWFDKMRDGRIWSDPLNTVFSNYSISPPRNRLARMESNLNEHNMGLVPLHGISRFASKFEPNRDRQLAFLKIQQRQAFYQDSILQPRDWQVPSRASNGHTGFLFTQRSNVHHHLESESARNSERLVWIDGFGPGPAAARCSPSSESST